MIKVRDRVVTSIIKKSNLSLVGWFSEGLSRGKLPIPVVQIVQLSHKLQTVTKLTVRLFC